MQVETNNRTRKSEVAHLEYNDDIDWQSLSPEEKKRALYEKQKKLLDTFLEHHAISQAQYDKSLGDLTDKMGYGKKR